MSRIINFAIKLSGNSMTDNSKNYLWLVLFLTSLMEKLMFKTTFLPYLRYGYRFTLIIFFFALAAPGEMIAQEKPPSSVSVLKKMTLEELMNIEVTTVSKTSQKLTEVASAIQVITHEDIRRSGVTGLPEALRLASNLQVAQLNAHDWAITARGFNGSPISGTPLANKLLVMIDGRSVYTPLFGGVFWDVQNVLLEDIDRIEVVSGPGGTLWGANAVNGVINILSKSARETQGFYATGAAGSLLQDHVAARYGGHVGSKVFYRAYGQFFHYRNTMLNDTSNHDKWNMIQGGFRMDYYPTEKNTVTVQGDLYTGTKNDPTSTIVNGQNVLASWVHTFSERSDITVQAYFDRTWRNFTLDTIAYEMRTYDIEFQHSFAIGKRQKVLWGGGYKLMQSRVRPGASFFPVNRDLMLYTGFIQDQIALIVNRLELTIGSKFLSHTYTRFEIQPSVRLAWTPNKQHTVWAAVSRAIRTPSRFEVDLINPPGIDFESENVIAYELGYRVEPTKGLSASLAGFYNSYTDIRSINNNLTPPPDHIFSNDQEAQTWGAELSAGYWIKNWWRVRAGYTYLGQKFEATDSTVDDTFKGFEAIDPAHQAMFQSIIDVKKNFQIDVVMRYVDYLPVTALTPRVSPYFTMDIRLAYRYRSLEFSIVGQNLAARKHREFERVQIPISIYGRITVRL